VSTLSDVTDSITSSQRCRDVGRVVVEMTSTYYFIRGLVMLVLMLVLVRCLLPRLITGVATKTKLKIVRTKVRETRNRNVSVNQKFGKRRT